MRRKRYATIVYVSQVKLGDVICERLAIRDGVSLDNPVSYSADHLVLPIGRVTGIGENPDGSFDFFLNSYVDPPDSQWYGYHKDETVIVVRNPREERSGERKDPRV